MGLLEAELRRVSNGFPYHCSTIQAMGMKKPPEGGSEFLSNFSGLAWLRGLDLNQRPSGYEPDELPGCSTPRYHVEPNLPGVERLNQIQQR